MVTAVVIPLLLLVCAFPILGKIRSSPSHSETGYGELGTATSVAELPGTIEMEIPLDGPETEPGATVSLALQSPRGERIAVLNGAIFVGKNKVRIPISEVLFIRGVESLGRLVYEVSDNGVVSIPVKDLAVLKDRVANGKRPKAVEGSRIWILGDTHIYFIRPNGEIDVQEGMAE